jgi:ketosteroid isomerase-like protein
VDINASAERTLLAWNAALDRRDVDALKSLYSPQVLYYGVRRTAEQVLQAKRDAFVQNSQYRQRVDNVQIAPSVDGISITFRKHSGPELRSSVKARIVLKARGDQLTITEETDAATDELLRRLEPKDCLDAALTIAFRQAVIARERERLARESPAVHQSAVIYESTEESVDANMGHFDSDRFIGHWGITVEDGELKIVDNWKNKPLPLSENDKTLIRRLCRRNARDASTDE